MASFVGGVYIAGNTGVPPDDPDSPYIYAEPLPPPPTTQFKTYTFDEGDGLTSKFYTGNMGGAGQSGETWLEQSGYVAEEDTHIPDPVTTWAAAQGSKHQPTNNVVSFFNPKADWTAPGKDLPNIGGSGGDPKDSPDPPAALKNGMLSVPMLLLVGVALLS